MNRLTEQMPDGTIRTASAARQDTLINDLLTRLFDYEEICYDADGNMLFSPDQLLDAITKMEQYQKGFALACRFIADNMDCPANVVNAEFHACEHSADEEYQEDAPHGTCEDGGWLCWQRYFSERVDSEPVCRVCGCTEDNACPGGCWWVEGDLCSACAAESGTVNEEKYDGYECHADGRCH